MTELIDKRELLNALNAESMKHHKNNIPMVEHDFRELINKMPTVDAVPVVRCMDCKNNSWNVADDGDVWPYCDELKTFIHPYGYCAWGERKDGTK